MTGTRLRATSERSEVGAGLVEFGLLAPLLFMILLGMVTGGLALSAKNSMTNAVREGARLGATLPEDPVDGWDGWAVHVRDRVTATSGGDLEAGEVCVEVVSITAASSTTDPPVQTREGGWPVAGCAIPVPVPATPGSVPVGSCVVKVWARTTATLNALFFTQSLDLDAVAVGRYERSECP